MNGERQAALTGFREGLYSCFARRADALFELCDAVLTAGTVPSPPHLSLASVHRRGWGSLYAALSKGRIDTDAVSTLLGEHPLENEVSKKAPPVYAVDVTSWPRCDAEASPERGYCYHPSRHSAGQPIVAGWAYQLVAEIGFARDTWVAPVDVRRVHPTEDANNAAAEQVRALLDRTSQGRAASLLTSPLFVFDAGYDPVRLQRNFEGYSVQILVRLHSTRTFYADPPEQKHRSVGRPSVQGEKFDLKDPSSWHEPSVAVAEETPGNGGSDPPSCPRHQRCPVRAVIHSVLLSGGPNKGSRNGLLRTPGSPPSLRGAGA